MRKTALKIIYIFLLLVVCLTSAKAQSVNYSKFGKGLHFITSDSSMLVKMQFRFQSLFIAEKSLTDGTDWQAEYLLRRARLKFGGWVLNPKIGYKVELGLSNRDISPSSDFDEVKQASRIVFDAVVKWKFAKNLTLWVGQTKLPGNRERVISSQKLQLVDRSLVNSRFNIDRDIGLQLHGKFNLGKAVLKPIVSWSMGEGRNITIGNVGGFDYTGRLEFLPMGEFTSKGDYFGADLAREETPKLSIATTVDFNDGASRERGQLGDFMQDSLGGYIQNDLTTVFADMMFKYNGFSFMAEYANKTAEKDTVDVSGNKYATGMGITAQAGYLLKNNWEFAGRYTFITPDDDTYSGIRETIEYTLGISKYFVGHALKVQTDYSIIDTQGAADPEFRFRFQVELAI